MGSNLMAGVEFPWKKRFLFSRDPSKKWWGRLRKSQEM